MAGTCFLLDQPLITLGRGTECDVLINDASISRQHAQFLRQVQGDYVQDLTSRNGTKVNNEPLTGPRLLVSGDVVSVGVITLQYSAVQSALTAPLPLILTPRPALRPISGPVPLRLPSRPRP
jgi:pSer/pThr/pTyr-binding forkhead associated (FHA) protein